MGPEQVGAICSGGWGGMGCEYSAEISFLLFLYVIFCDLYYIQGNINTMQANFLV